jgi:hypothetical protein
VPKPPTALARRPSPPQGAPPRAPSRLGPRTPPWR